jgi:HlyD family secretion protein
LQNQANLLKAETDFQRSRDLHQRQLISPAEFLAAETTLAVARANHESALANIRRAEGQLSQARDQLEKTTILAPIDGTVSRLVTEVGERVAGTGQFNAAVIMHVADLATMEVVVDVNENDVVRVKLGDEATLMVDALPDTTFTGRVTEIASTARTTGANTQDQVTNFEVRIRILDPGAALRPGMSATADIATATVTEAVAVPIQAVTVRSREDDRTLEQVMAEREKDAKASAGEGAAVAVNEREQRARAQRDRASLQRVVFVVEGDRVKQVPVETGIADSTHMEIKSGLTAGQRVVSGNFNTITRVLRDDMAVRVEQPRAGRKQP